MVESNTDLRTNLEYYTLLSHHKEQKFYKDSLKEVSKCPECNSDEYISLYVRGKPIHTAIEVAKKTKFLILKGCLLVNDDDYLYTCRKCNKDFN